MKDKIFIYIHDDIEDTHFKRPQHWMAKIIDAGHKAKQVHIGIAEGVALEQIGCKDENFIDILKMICRDNNWDIGTKFHFCICNPIQNKNIGPSIEAAGDVTNWNDQRFTSAQQQNFTVQKKIEKTFGCFIRRSSWDRLLISSHLYYYHNKKSLLTYRNWLSKPSDMINIDVDRCLWHLSQTDALDGKNLHTLFEFLKALPLLRTNDTSDTDLLANLDITENKKSYDEIFSWYNEIFVDVVCEKVVAGQSFFPTEKTARPLFCKTPFLIMSTKNFLYNLKRNGFKTFSKFWSEDYDQLEGADRVYAINKIIDEVASYTQGDLTELLKQMDPILEHNYKTYMKIK